MTDNTSNIVVILSIIVAGIITYFLYAIGELFGIGIYAATQVIFSILITVFLTWLANTYVAACSDFFSFRQFWPVSLALIWLSCWPAIRVWAQDARPFTSVLGEPMRAWWGMWYGVLLITLAIVFIGIAINYLLLEAYRR